MGLSVYVSFFHDFTFLRQVLERISPFADEIVMVDGPNFSAVPAFAALGIPVDSQSCRDKLEQALPSELKARMVYHWGIWANEIEKRRFGYSLCRNNIRITLDADELIDFGPGFLDDFVSSGKPVGAFDCINMYTHDVFLGSDIYDYRRNVMWKCAVFRADMIDDLRHLDYLWLAQYKANPIKASDTEPHLGTMYHATSVRNLSGKLTKAIFYRALKRGEAGREELTEWSRELWATDKNRIARSQQDFIGFSTQKKYYRDPAPESRNESIIATVKAAVEDTRAQEFGQPLKIWPGESWYRLSGNSTFEMRGEKLEILQVYKVVDGKTATICDENDVMISQKNDSIEIDFLDQSEHIAEPALRIVVKSEN